MYFAEAYIDENARLTLSSNGTYVSVRQLTKAAAAADERVGDESLSPLTCYISIHLCIYSFMNLSIYMFIYSFIYSFAYLPM